MHFDALILGSGQAGNPLAAKLSARGLKVGFVERAAFGGTCINVGCTPTKVLVHRAQVAHYVRNSSRWGVRSSLTEVDLREIVRQKDAIVSDWSDSQRQSLEDDPNVHVVRAQASFTGPRTVTAGGQELSADKVFINTGAEPVVPNLPGIEQVDFLTNESILQLTTIPEHLIVLGGGYIGIEFAQMFLRFGSKVTVIQRGPQIVPIEDPEIAECLQSTLSAEGMKFLMNTTARELKRDGDSVVVSLEDGSSVSGSHLLVAIGRRPRTHDLNLPAAGVEVDERGAVKVNERLETTAENVWALGDVKGGPAFTHISYDDFLIVYDNLYEGRNRSTTDRIIPYSVFTDPQLGAVGMTEREARAKGYRIKVGTIPMSRVARAVERDETDGMMKIVVDAESGCVLGVRILGVEGGETVQVFSMLIAAKLPYTFLREFIFIHPTLAEGLFYLIKSLDDQP